jgi:hypothetical protein
MHARRFRSHAACARKIRMLVRAPRVDFCARGGGPIPRSKNLRTRHGRRATAPPQFGRFLASQPPHVQTRVPNLARTRPTPRAVPQR